MPRALTARDTRGLIKLVADGGTRKLLGAHILAPEGADSSRWRFLVVVLRMPQWCRSCRLRSQTFRPLAMIRPAIPT
ncbi:hypothetical protein OVY29_21525 [Sphingopyxis sp. SE2]|uniref:hypothetical protein n=1 Tax=Sphingopyxis sp. SE2 TaxID=1586240 RepID=UPI0028C15EE5|nr:hypothetical protein [Sphingopyxis sp. SE2]